MGITEGPDDPSTLSNDIRQALGVMPQRAGRRRIHNRVLTPPPSAALGPANTRCRPADRAGGDGVAKRLPSS